MLCGMFIAQKELNEYVEHYVEEAFAKKGFFGTNELLKDVRRDFGTLVTEEEVSWAMTCYRLKMKWEKNKVYMTEEYAPEFERKQKEAKQVERVIWLLVAAGVGSFFAHAFFFAH